MLRLSLKSEPVWHDLARGLRVLVMPVTSTHIETARASLTGPIEDAEDGEDAQAVPSLLDWGRALAPEVIVDWDGVCDEDSNPVPPEPEWIGAALDDDAVWRAFRDKILLPAMVVADEGNGSTGAPNGTSAAPDTASPA